MAVSGTFTGVGQSDSIQISRSADLSLEFGTGTVVLQRSFDGGNNWHTIQSYTGDAQEAIEPGTPGYIYRLNCTAHSANIDYRIG